MAFPNQNKIWKHFVKKGIIVRPLNPVNLDEGETLPDFWLIQALPEQKLGKRP